MGLRPQQVRVLPTDRQWRLQPDAVTAAVRADRNAGRVPFALCASGGSTNTGAVDPLAGLADVCAAEGLWLHVDAAYGGFAARRLRVHPPGHRSQRRARRAAAADQRRPAVADGRRAHRPGGDSPGPGRAAP
jgi:hypothetical protein